ncbi:hypothetical protein PVK06_036474 [Gossypium arboreum]|uniref:Uncharacterized protein n=1 Tax=Gossypium arboreum TaxID=29729 RepID=A0ABR0NKU1_GOSAR|nr:hypothetical protein PVK06_036474 [Gossypium arboreum]
MKANGKEPQSTTEKDRSKEIGVRESKGNEPWIPPNFNLVIISSTTLPESNHTAVIIEDDNTLVGHFIACSSKDPMHAMRGVGTFMHEITKCGLKCEKTKSCQIFRTIAV